MPTASETPAAACAREAQAFPLVAGFAANATFAWRLGVAIDVERFLRDVAALAQSLPSRRYLLNTCSDRYRFTVAFSAALVRGQVNLLPPNHTPHVLEELCSAYPDVYCLTESTLPMGTMEVVQYPDDLDASSEAHEFAKNPSFAGDQLAAIIFTSGSTGAPLPQRKTWSALVQCARAEARVLGVDAMQSMTLVGTVPAQHMYGLESTVLLSMQAGLACAAARPFYPADVRAELARYPRPRLLVTTPVHLRALLADETDLPPLDVLLSATAPLSPQLAMAAQTRFGAPLYEIYGCTEAGAVAMRQTVVAPLWETLPGLSLRQDAERTTVLGGHVSGEVVLADVIELRDAQHFILHGRTADLVNIAGKRTSLAHLNHHLNSIAGVRDGVFVAPFENAAEAHDGTARLSAFVVAPGLTAADILSALRERIDQVFLPRPLHIVDALPRNPTGKLTREALRALLPALATPVPRSGALTYSFASDHPTAAGHFPGNPIIPGALLLSAVVDVIAKDIGIDAMPCTMNAVKFLSPLKPGETLMIEYSERTNGAIDFSCEVGGRTVMSGHLQCHANR